MRGFGKLNSGLQRFAAAATIAVLASSSTAQQKVPVTASGPYRIAGKLVNATTGEPVRRATVGVLAEEDSHLMESVQTDAEGQFVLEHLPAGKYPLTASKRGYRTSFFEEHDEFNSAIVTGPDQDTSHLVFRLAPNAVLYGVVSGDGGEPVEGASVLLFAEGGEHGGADNGNNEVDATTTDDTGAYEFPNLASGEYRIAVSATPWYAMHSKLDAGGALSPLDVAYPVTYYDSTIDEASAAPIQLQEGIRQQADIAIHAVPALRLKVAVPIRRSGLARPELKKMVFGKQISAESTGFLDALQTGSTEFTGLAPGKYQLTQGDPPRVVNMDLSANEDADPNSGTPAESVSGMVMFANGAPLGEVATVTLEPAGEPRGRTTMQALVRKGAFHFDAVEAGAWTVSVISQAQAEPVIAIAQSGSASAVAGSQIFVKDQPVVFSAIVSPSLTRVTGFARDDTRKGMAGAMVVLVPRRAAAYRALLRRDQSDSDGSFNLRDVTPGPYILIAIEDGWKLDWTHRENLLRYLQRGVPVNVPDRPAPVVNLAVPVPVQAR